MRLANCVSLMVLLALSAQAMGQVKVEGQVREQNSTNAIGGVLVRATRQSDGVVLPPATMDAASGRPLISINTTVSPLTPGAPPPPDPIGTYRLWFNVEPQAIILDFVPPEGADAAFHSLRLLSATGNQIVDKRLPPAAGPPSAAPALATVALSYKPFSDDLRTDVDTLLGFEEFRLRSLSKPQNEWSPFDQEAFKSIQRWLRKLEDPIVAMRRMRVVDRDIQGAREAAELASYVSRKRLELYQLYQIAVAPPLQPTCINVRAKRFCFLPILRGRRR
jgi:hypothetical protein